MTLKELRIASGMARKEFAEYFGISYRTVQKWELHDTGSPEGRKCPEYLQNLMRYKLVKEGIIMPIKLYTFHCFDMAGNTDAVFQCEAKTLEDANEQFQKYQQEQKYELEINDIFIDEIE